MLFWALLSLLAFIVIIVIFTVCDIVLGVLGIGEPMYYSNEVPVDMAYIRSLFVETLGNYNATATEL